MKRRSSAWGQQVLPRTIIGVGPPLAVPYRELVCGITTYLARGEFEGTYNLNPSGVRVTQDRSKSTLIHACTYARKHNSDDS